MKFKNHRMKSGMYLLLALLSLQTACSDGTNESKTTADSDHTSLDTPVPPTIEQNENTDSLGYLTQYLNKQPSAVGMWETEPLQTRLKELLGDQYKLFMQTMEEASPLQQERVLYTIGTYPDQAINGLGFLLIDTDNNKLHVSLVFDKTREQFQTIGEDFYMPQEVKQHLQEAL